MYFRNIIILLFLLLAGTTLAQEQPEYEKSIYRSAEGKLYINKEAPVYLRIASSPDEDTSSHLLRSEETSQFSNPMYLDAEGYNTIRSPWKVDPETRKYVFPKEDVVFEIYADSKAPQTTLDLNTEDVVIEQNKIFVGEETHLQFNAEDEMAGVEDVYYSINQKPYQKYSQPVQLNDEEKFTLKYYAVDHVGNAEEPKENEIIIDLSEPETNYEIEGDQHNNVLSERSKIQLSASDQITNVDQTYYSIDGGEERTYNQPLITENLSEGEHTLTFYSVDKVNNKEKRKEFQFYLDKTPPRVIEELMGDTYTANGKEYISGKNRLKLVSMDNKAGVKEIRYSINGGPFQKYTQPFSLNKPGDLDIEIQAIDSVNNSKREKKLTDRSHASYVDITGPQLDYQFVGPVFNIKDTAYISRKTNIKLTGEDDESGFSRIEYSVKDNEDMKKYEEPFAIKEEGSYSVQYTGYDNLDNTSLDEFVCRVDTKGPEIFQRFSMVSDSQKTVDGRQYPVFPEHVVLFLSATDKHVGFDKMHYSINGSDKKLYNNQIKGFDKGAYDVKVTAVDKLGNEEEKEIHFYIE
ncbi:MAG: OmpL47-type beta-barrel domain-containing protein [Bacteroidota bacterium]